MKILFICKNRSDVNYSNGSFGLINSAELICEVLSEGIECKTILVNDANSIDKEVYNYNPDVIIIEALWVTPKKLEEIINLHKQRFFIVRIHSKIPFLSYEGVAIKWLKELNKLSSKNDHLRISHNNITTCSELSVLLRTKVLYLPNIYKVTKNNKIKKRNPKEVSIGCFGSIRPLKNTLIQAVAAIIFADLKNLKLYFNVNDKAEQSGDQVLKNIRSLFEDSKHVLIEHSWYTHSDFVEVVSSMDLGMQVSFSESFNIVVADFISNNVPIVVSNEINYLPSFNYAETNSVNSIVDTLNFLYKNNRMAITKNKTCLKKFSDESIIQWIKTLKEL
jgi:hypothetical protein